MYYKENWELDDVLNKSRASLISSWNPDKRLVAYMDGAYDQEGRGGAQKAGFGFTIVTGGDGRKDEEARVVARW